MPLRHAVGVPACVSATRARGVAVLLPLLIAGAATGCGGQHATSRAPSSPSAARTASPAPARRPVGLQLTHTATLPAPIQLPGLARTTDGRVVAVGGLDAADASTATVTQVLPSPARAGGRLPQAAHDIGVTAIGRTVYAFGGGTAAGPIDTITALGGGRGAARPAGRLPEPLSDTTAVTLGRTAFLIGGYTTTTPQRSVLAFEPGQAVHVAAQLPHPVRYAAAAAIGRRIYVAGGTTGTHAWRDIVEVDPVTGHARVVGRLPRPLAHAAGATLNGIFYVIGGRGDAPNAQQATIWAFDPGTRRISRAGRLPVALSDVAAVADGARLVVVGGRDRAGGVHAERWILEPA